MCFLKLTEHELSALQTQILYEEGNVPKQGIPQSSGVYVCFVSAYGTTDTILQ